MMNCFPCFSCIQKEDEGSHYAHVTPQPKVARTTPPQPKHTGYIQWATPLVPKVNNTRKETAKTVDNSDIEATQYTFRELLTATKNFRQECLIGECGYGRIYKGTIQPSGQIVMVKRLDKNSSYGNKEFLVEVHMLSLLRHSNLLKLVGYCADGDQRLLVYEYMSMGSVQEHLLGMDVNKETLDWETRMKIACGIAQGIEYLHDKAKPSVIYRDLKCTNIMLDKDFTPKLSDHGLARLIGNNQSQVTVMGTYGYCAPEYEKHGQLTVKSDVYNFGVVLLEIITGRAAVDTSKIADEQNLVKWAQPFIRDPRRFPEMADLHLNNSFPVKSLNQAVGIAAMCLQDEPEVRPVMGDVVAALTSLLANMEKDALVPLTKQEKKALSRRQTRNASLRDPSDYSECSWSDDYSDEESDDEIEYGQNDPTNQYDKKDTRVAEESDQEDIHMDEEISYHKNQGDQKDTRLDANIGYHENQYDYSSTDEESDTGDHYDQKDTRVAGEIDYRKNQSDQENIHRDEESSYHKNQYDQKDTRLDAKIGYHENQNDYVSTDEESDTDEDQDEHEHLCTNKKIDYEENQYDQKDTRVDAKIGYHENQNDYVSTDEESNTDEDQDEHEHVCTDEKIDYEENQYDQKDTHGDPKIGYHENQNDYVSTDEESDIDEDQDEHEHVCTDEKIGCEKNQDAQHEVCKGEERGYNEDDHEQKGGMDKESVSDYDSESSNEDVSPSSRQSSQDRSALLGSKGRHEKIMKDEEEIGSYSMKSSSVGVDNASVYEKNQSIGSSYSWQSSFERHANGNVRSGGQSP